MINRAFRRGCPDIAGPPIVELVRHAFESFVKQRPGALRARPER